MTPLRRGYLQRNKYCMALSRGHLTGLRYTKNRASTRRASSVGSHPPSFMDEEHQC